MATLDAIRVNDTVFSWESSLAKIDGIPFTDIAAIDSSQKRERKKVFAGNKSGKAKGRTRGKFSVDSLSMKVLIDTATRIKAYLAQKSATGKSYGDRSFTIELQLVEPGNDPITVFIDKVVITGEKDAREEGVEELLVEFELDAMTIETNGLHLWSDDA